LLSLRTSDRAILKDRLASGNPVIPFELLLKGRRSVPGKFLRRWTTRLALIAVATAMRLGVLGGVNALERCHITPVCHLER
jgi:hypothetical protein